MKCFVSVQAMSVSSSGGLFMIRRNHVLCAPRFMRTMRDEAAKVPSHYAMPCGTFFRIELRGTVKTRRGRCGLRAEEGIPLA
jgi:hypothetical protein